MKKKDNRFYLYNNEVWKSDDKKLRFFKLAQPDCFLDYSSLHPDELDKFVQIVPNPETYIQDNPQERLYRVIIDTSTVIFLTPQSYKDISNNVLNYLQEIEEWERMCVVRDMGKYYDFHKKRKEDEIKKIILDNEKTAASGKT